MTNHSGSMIVGLIAGLLVAHIICAALGSGPKYPGDQDYEPGIGCLGYLLALVIGGGLGALVGFQVTLFS